MLKSTFYWFSKIVFLIDLKKLAIYFCKCKKIVLLCIICVLNDNRIVIIFSLKWSKLNKKKVKTRDNTS